MINKQMNFRFLPGALIFLLTMAGLAACASHPAAPATVAKPTANTSESTAPADAAGITVSFSKDILPILEDTCVSCHGGEKTSKGLDLKSYTSLMIGSQNGAVIVAGEATKSKLVQSVRSGKMPKRGVQLTTDQLQMLVDWVNAGATNN